MTTEELLNTLMDFPSPAQVVVESEDGVLKSIMGISYTGANYRDLRLYEDSHGSERVLILRAL